MISSKGGIGFSSGGAITIKDHGTAVAGQKHKINFTGAGVTVTQDGTYPDQVNISISGGGGGGGGYATIQSNGSSRTQRDTLNFNSLFTVTDNSGAGRTDVTIASGGISNAMLANSAVTVAAGTGLSGGGSVSLGGTTTVNLGNTAVTAGAYGSASAVATYTVDAQGRLTLASSVSIQITESQVTNLTTDLAAKAPTTRNLIAGAGLTGGGDLSADRTFNVVANADGSIVANANDIQVGVLATDAQHGDRGGGSLHTDVVSSGASGFMSGADKAILDGLATGSVPSTRTLTADTGLTGGGDLSADRSFAIADTTVVADTYGNGANSITLTVNAQGQLTAAADVSIQIAESQVTNLVTDLGDKADKTTTVSAGTGLTGGGDLSTNRSFDLADTAVVADSYGDAANVATFTVDQQGRLVAAADATIQITESQVTNLTSDLGLKADDSAVVHLAGTETITGDKTFTSAVTLPSAAPTNPTDAASKAYVDSVAAGLKPKEPVVLLATSNIALSGLSPIDGVTPSAGNRILAVGQSTSSENGIWVADASTWSRPADFAAGQHAQGVYTLVLEGTTWALSGWVCNTLDPNDVVDSNNLAFVQFNGTADIAQGAGISITGNTISVANAPFTTGSVLFADAVGNIGQDASNLVYDVNNARLGVGTNTTGYPIHIAAAPGGSGWGNISLGIDSNTTEAGFSLNNTATGGRQYTIISTSDTSGAGGGRLSIGDATAGTHRITILSSGFVGIATLNPSTTLDVNGGIHAGGSIVDSGSQISVNADGRNLCDTSGNPLLDWSTPGYVIAIGNYVAQGSVRTAGTNTTSFFESVDGQNVAVSNANEMRLRYNDNTHAAEVSFSSGAYSALALAADVPAPAGPLGAIQRSDGSGDFTDSGNAFLSSANLAIDSTQAIYFNGVSDPTWRMGRNLSAYTKSILSGNTFENVIGTSITPYSGWSIGNNGGTSIFEINNNGNVYTSGPFVDASVNKSADLNNRALYASDGTTVNMNWSVPNQVLIKSAVDGVSAFEVQKADATVALSVNTVQQWLGVGKTPTNGVLDVISHDVNGTAFNLNTATTWTGGSLQLWQNGGATQASMDYNGSLVAQHISANAGFQNYGDARFTGTNSNTYIEMTDGEIVGPSNANEGRLIYNSDNQCWMLSANAGGYYVIQTGGNTTLRSVYNNGLIGDDSTILLNAGAGPVRLLDDGSPIGGSLFTVADNSGSLKFVDVTSAGVSTTGNLFVAGGLLDSLGGAVSLSGPNRIAYASDSSDSILWDARQLRDESSSPALNWGTASRQLLSPGSSIALDWTDVNNTTLNHNTSLANNSNLTALGNSQFIADNTSGAALMRLGQKANDETVWSLNVDQNNSDAIDDVTRSSYKFAMQTSNGYDGFGIQRTDANAGSWGGTTILFLDGPTGNLKISGNIIDNSGTNSVSPSSRFLYDSNGSGLLSINWDDRNLYANDGSTVVLNYSDPASFIVQTGLRVSAADTATYLELSDGQNVGNSNSNEGRIRFNASTETFESSVNGANYLTMPAMVTGGSQDKSIVYMNGTAQQGDQYFRWDQGQLRMVLTPNNDVNTGIELNLNQAWLKSNIESGNFLVQAGPATLGTDNSAGTLVLNGGVDNLMLHAPSPSTAVSLSTTANFDSTTTPIGPFNIANPSGTSSFSTAITIIDGLAISHTATIYFGNDGGDTWEWNVTVDGGEVSGGTGGQPFLIGNGNINYSGSTFSSQNTFSSLANWIDGASPQSVTYDFSNSTQNAASSFVPITIDGNGSYFSGVGSGNVEINGGPATSPSTLYGKVKLGTSHTSEVVFGVGIYDTNDVLNLDLPNRLAYKSDGSQSMDWENHGLLDGLTGMSIAWRERHLYAGDATALMLDWSDPAKLLVGDGTLDRVITAGNTATNKKITILGSRSTGATDNTAGSVYVEGGADNPSNVPFVASTTMNFSATANLDSTAAAPPAFDVTNPGGTSNAGSGGMLEIDALGNSHSTAIWFRTQANGTWEWYHTVDGAEINGGTPSVQFIIGQGTITYSGGTFLSQNTSFSSADWLNGAGIQSLTYDFSNSTGNAAATTLPVVLNGNVLYQIGVGAGDVFINGGNSTATSPVPGNVHLGADHTTAIFVGAPFVDVSEIRSVDVINRTLNNASGTASVDYQNNVLIDTVTSGLQSVDWGGRSLTTQTGNQALNWNDSDILYIGDGASNRTISLPGNLDASSSSISLIGPAGQAGSDPRPPQLGGQIIIRSGAGGDGTATQAGLDGANLILGGGAPGADNGAGTGTRGKIVFSDVSVLNNNAYIRLDDGHAISGDNGPAGGIANTGALKLQANDLATSYLTLDDSTCSLYAAGTMNLQVSSGLSISALTTLVTLDSNTTLSTAVPGFTVGNYDQTSNNFVATRYLTLDSTPTQQTVGLVGIQVVDHTAAAMVNEYVVAVGDATPTLAEVMRLSTTKALFSSASNSISVDSSVGKISNTTGDFTLDTDVGTAAQTTITVGHNAQAGSGINGTRIAIQGGFGNASAGGAVSIKGGNADGTDQNGGAIGIDAGAPTGTGSAAMLLGFVNAKSIIYGNTNTTHYVKGVHKIGNTGLLAPAVAREVEVPARFQTTDDTDQLMWSYTPPVSTTYIVRAEILATDDGTGGSATLGASKWFLLRARVTVSNAGAVFVKALPSEHDDDPSTSNWAASITTDGTSIKLVVSGDTGINAQWSASIDKQLNSYL